MEFYTRGDSVRGSVPVVPPDGWPSRTGGRPRGGGARRWSVGGTDYPSWGDAWRALHGGRQGGAVPSAAAYLRAWSVSDGDLSGLAELLSPAPVAPSTAPVAPSAAPSAQVGIDLSRRGVEVRKLLYAGFGFRMARCGYDPEEVLQEVYRGILVRNRGRCPFDARKSSFGHYVHMVIECILSNYHRKESRRRDSESSWEDLADGHRERVSDGVGSAPTGRGVDGGSDGLALRMVSDAVRCFPGLTEREEGLALGVLPLLQAGYAATPRGAKEAGWPWADWRDGVAVLRRVVSADAGGDRW